MLIGTIEHNKKSPRGIGPRRYSPSPQCVIYVTVTQDTSPGGKAEVCHEDLFGRARTGGLGQVSMKKKTGITRRRPDGTAISKVVHFCSMVYIFTTLLLYCGHRNERPPESVPRSFQE